MMGVLTDFVLRKIADRFGLGGSEVETRTAWPPMWWPQSAWHVYEFRNADSVLRPIHLVGLVPQIGIGNASQCAVGV